MKNLAVPVLVVLAVVVCVVVSVNANRAVATMNQALIKERHQRMTAEAALQQVRQENARLKAERADLDAKLQGIQDIITQGQSKTQKLQEQLEVLAREKADLTKKVETLQTRLQSSVREAATAAP